jgi:hypothetical protein
MQTKICSRCGKEKGISEFSPQKRGRLGVNSWCRKCHCEYEKNRRKTDPEFRKVKHEYNVLEWATRPEENKKSYNYKRRQRHAENKEEDNAKSRENWRNNPDKRKSQNDKKMNRYHSDPDFRIKENLRSRLRQALVGSQKKGSAIRDLGCSIPELRVHLESKFLPGMTWENRGIGKGKWNIDHVMPLSAFNLSDRQHLILACYYLNLQPMWTEDNVSKGNRY